MPRPAGLVERGSRITTQTDTEGRAQRRLDDRVAVVTGELGGVLETSTLGSVCRNLLSIQFLRSLTILFHHHINPAGGGPTSHLPPGGGA